MSVSIEPVCECGHVRDEHSPSGECEVEVEPGVYCRCCAFDEDPGAVHALAVACAVCGASVGEPCRDSAGAGRTCLKRKAAAIVARRAPDVSAPVPMVLHCPECRARHIDEGVFATKGHHTHACQECGFTWRPAVITTIGVRFLPGFKNGVAAAAQCADRDRKRAEEAEARVTRLETAIADCAHTATTAKTRDDLHDGIYEIARAMLGDTPWTGSAQTCVAASSDSVSEVQVPK